MSTPLSRRDFLKLSGLTLTSLALTPGVYLPAPLGHSRKRSDAAGLVRVAVREVPLYSEPTYDSEAVATRKRDQLLYVYEEFESELGPDFNPRWYRMDEGYAHTAYLQPVKTQLQSPVHGVSEEGELFEVTVPLTQSYRNTLANGWEKLYRLYYRSTHWVTAVTQGPDGGIWYEITDKQLRFQYYVLAEHMRKIPASELTPINPQIEDKRVEVSIAEQRLWVYEEGALLLDTKISTGIPRPVGPGETPTATPKGRFNVYSKMPAQHMGYGQLTSDLEAYELPGVPWVSYFHEWGVAFHGTYWHDNYGNDMSRGCVNMKPDEAKWLFRWLLPQSNYGQAHTVGFGTRVVVF